MKVVHESIFMNSLRAFFVVLFGALGGIIAISAACLVIVGISAAADEDDFSSKVKILPDANGSRKALCSSTPVLLQINLNGKIGEDQLTGEKIENLLLDSREDDFKKGRVKGILLAINSPGGGAIDSDVIYRHLKLYKERYHVPVYAFVDGMCASGGYYIACSADKIYASDVSLIGSVGVLAWPPFMNVYDALNKIGVGALTLSAGKGKDEMNPFRPWKEGEQEHYQQLINYFYGRFVDIVSADRPDIDREELVGKLGAEVFPAPKAQEMGLIDCAGCTRSDALRGLAKEAGIEDQYQVVSLETRSWWRRVFKQESRVKHELILPKLEQTSSFSYIFP